MINLQVKESVQREGGKYLDVIKVWKTIQGEGPLVGVPAVFIRLAGCNLTCPKCDTNYTEGRYTDDVQDVCEAVDALKTRTVVITGGEPFRQPIGTLVRKLIMRGHPVQIETNGTLFLEDFPWQLVTIVCSPKSPVVHAQVAPYITALKYVLSADAVDSEDGLPTAVLGLDVRPARPWNITNLQDRLLTHRDNVYLQPADDQGETPQETEKNNLRHLNAALDSCFKYGYRLSLQTHKLLGLE